MDVPLPPFEPHAAEVGRVANWLARRWHLDRADVLSELVLILLERGGSYDAARGPFGPWLLRAGRGRLARRAKRERGLPRYTPMVEDLDDPLAGIPDTRHPNPATAAELALDGEAAVAALAGLPARERVAVEGLVCASATRAAVAELLGMTREVAGQYARRGVEQLRRRLR